MLPAMCRSQNGLRNWGDDGRKIKCQINMGCLIARVDDDLVYILVVTVIIVLSIMSESVYAEARKSKF